jgi:hypothetical protein
VAEIALAGGDFRGRSRDRAYRAIAALPAPPRASPSQSPSPATCRPPGRDTRRQSGLAPARNADQYIIIVALIAIAAIGVTRQNIVRGQTSVAATSRRQRFGNWRGLVGNTGGRANNEGRQKELNNFEQ